MSAALPETSEKDSRWSILVAVSVPLAVLSIDFAGVSVALPSIGEDLNATQQQLGLVIGAFALGSAAPVLLVGRTVDRLGRRKVLVAGLLLFMVASLVCATSVNMWWLITGRLLQGGGTALFMPASLAVLSAAFAGSARDRAVGVWGAVAGVSGAAAPIVAGLILTAASWRWFFGINVVLLAGAILLTQAVITESTGDPAAVARRSAILGVASPALLVLGLQLGATRGWMEPGTVAALAASVVSTVAFAMEERRSGSPLIERAVRSSRGLRSSATVASLTNWGFGALTFLLTFWLQDEVGLSAIATGAVFLLYSVPFAVLGATNGQVVAKFGTAAPMTVGSLLVAASFAVLVFLGHGEARWPVISALLLSGVGQGLAYNVSTTAAVESVSRQHAGTASGVLTTMRNIGVAAGVSVAMTATGVSESDLGTAIAWAAVIIAAVSLLSAAVAWRSKRWTGGASVS